MPARSSTAARPVKRSSPASDDASNIGAPRRSGSFVAVLSNLEVNESAARVQRIDPATTLDEFARKSADWREALRNTCATSMRQAKARTGGDYSIEIADTLTASRLLYLTAIVTRVA